MESERARVFYRSIESISFQSPRFCCSDLDFNKPSVFFVRWFRTPFFEEVVYAVGVLVVTSLPDG